METIKKLLDDVKKAKGVESDYALAKALDLQRGHICDYYKGKRHPNEFACLRIAKAMSRDYSEISAIVRMEAEKDETRREEWRSYFKSIGGMAASVMLAVLAAVTLFVTTPGNALANQGVKTDISTNYKLCVLFRQIRRRILAVLHRLSSAFVRPGFAG